MPGPTQGYCLRGRSRGYPANSGSPQVKGGFRSADMAAAEQGAAPAWVVWRVVQRKICLPGRVAVSHSARWSMKDGLSQFSGSFSPSYN